MKIALVVVVAGLTAPAVVRAGGPDPDGRVVFARGTSLWLTDGRGKAAALEVATLPGPASNVSVIRSDRGGTTLLIQAGSQWLWTRMPTAQALVDGKRAVLSPLPCGPSAARLSQSGDCVVCASATNTALLVRLDDGKQFTRDLPGSTALAEHDGHRELVWVADGAIRAAAITDRKTERVVTPIAPLRGLVVAPDGSRAVGVYSAPPTGQPRITTARDQLFGFLLDGKAARRRLVRDGVVLDWSWDSQWLLLQDGGKACVARAVGGETKCWKGFTALSLSDDGAFALVLGPRDGGKPSPDEPAHPSDSDEGADNDNDNADDSVVARPTGPLSLFRAKLPGTYTERPVVIETIIDGAAVWMPPAVSPAVP